MALLRRLMRGLAFVISEFLNFSRFIARWYISHLYTEFCREEIGFFVYLHIEHARVGDEEGLAIAERFDEF